ncbi:hypothetical protein [Bradyrhizobium sp. CCBAU 051011]|uniref:hypothetical protein n=1 Tax=Bradyrhizobium sp. CCBAU 051011 TaxID=858422 RepID=UPI001379DD1A|nr:hypothetical protein [Bradyrhizobium sp. CCBAU 051011]
MKYSDLGNVSGTASPPRKRRTPPTEQTDEASGLMGREQVDVEREIPTEHNEEIEQAERGDRPDPPLFED